MMRASAYNRFGVLMGTSSRASGPRWLNMRGDSLPMITLISSQGDFCATASPGSVAVVTLATPPKPANWRKSIAKHTVTCLECGQSLKQLSVRHLKEHGLDGRSYRVKYGIP